MGRILIYFYNVACSGEVPIAQTQQAYKLTPYSATKQGTLGAICVTNFKIHFLPYEDETGQSGQVRSEIDKIDHASLLNICLCNEKYYPSSVVSECLSI